MTNITPDIRRASGIGLRSPTGIWTYRNGGRHRVGELWWVTLRNVIELAEEGSCPTGSTFDEYLFLDV